MGFAGAAALMLVAATDQRNVAPAEGAQGTPQAIAATATTPVGANAAFAPSRSGGMIKKTAYVITRSSDGLFYVNATIDGNPIRFLVDTGANVTVLTRSDAERLGLSDGQPNMGRATLRTAGGPTSMQWTRIPVLSVADRPVENVNAAIIDRGIEVSLLGQNVLSRLEGMTFTGDQLRFH
jgi:aspartyl protease family protein